MKELTIEQKAKAYDRALEIANAAYKDEDRHLKATLERIFPELKESEDDKVRKKLIHLVKKSHEQGGYALHKWEADEMLAWLERQRQEPKKVSIWKHWKDGICGNGEGKLIYLIKNGDDYRLSSCLGFECDYIELSELDNLMLEKQGTSYTKRDVDDAFVEEMAFAKDELEKQNEQKLADKEEPKFKVGDWVVVSTIKGDRVVQIASVEYLKDGYPSYITTEGRWFGNGTKARLLTDKDVEITTIPESKIVVSKSKYWSEEDEHWRQKIIDFMKHPDLIKSTPTLAKHTIDWLESLKQRYFWKPNGKNEKLTDVNHEYFSELLESDDSKDINDYAYQVAYCISHDWLKETATWDDVEKACKLGAEWNKRHHKSAWSDEDKKMIGRIRSIVEKYAFSQSAVDVNGDLCGKEYIDADNWLKSLKQRIGG